MLSIAVACSRQQTGHMENRKTNLSGLSVNQPTPAVRVWNCLLASNV